ncbi:hypothetical protein GCM10009525_84170 [Streptosporangium amethystogenes subsp. fukuiense]
MAGAGGRAVPNCGDGLPPNAVPAWAHSRVRCREHRRAEGLTITPVGLPLGHLEAAGIIMQGTGT